MLSPRKSEPASSNSYATPSYVAPSSASASYARDDDTSPSIVNKHLTMRGDLESEGDILVKGKVHGNIRCKLLIVDVDALIEGGITADEVVVRGRTKGLIEANKVRLEKSAIVDSEISHMTFSAEEGARIKGALKFRDEPISTQVKTIEAKAA